MEFKVEDDDCLENRKPKTQANELARLLGKSIRMYKLAVAKGNNEGLMLKSKREWDCAKKYYLIMVDSEKRKIKQELMNILNDFNSIANYVPKLKRPANNDQKDQTIANLRNDIALLRSENNNNNELSLLREQNNNLKNEIERLKRVGEEEFDMKDLEKESKDFRESVDEIKMNEKKLEKILEEFKQKELQIEKDCEDKLKIQQKQIENLQKENELFKKQRSLEEDNKDDIKAYTKLLNEINGQSVINDNFRQIANKISKKKLIEDLFREKRNAVGYEIDFKNLERENKQPISNLKKSEEKNDNVQELLQRNNQLEKKIKEVNDEILKCKNIIEDNEYKNEQLLIENEQVKNLKNQINELKSRQSENNKNNNPELEEEVRNLKKKFEEEKDNDAILVDLTTQLSIAKQRNFIGSSSNNSEITRLQSEIEELKRKKENVIINNSEVAKKYNELRNKYISLLEKYKKNNNNV